MQNEEFAPPSFTVTMGNFDFNSSRPFLSSCERENTTDTTYNPTTSDRYDFISRPQKMLITDSSSGEAFANELLSPISEGMSSAPWMESCNQLLQQQCSNNMDRATAAKTDCSAQAHAPQSRCHKLGRRFLSSETISSTHSSQYEEKDIRTHEKLNSISVIENEIMRESVRIASTRSRDSNKTFTYRDANRITGLSHRKSLDQAFKAPPPIELDSANVLQEIDLAVLLAQSRYHGTPPSRSFSIASSPCHLTDRNTYDRQFGSNEDHATNSLKVIATRKKGEAPSLSSSARYFMGNEWKRKSNYHDSSIEALEKKVVTTDCCSIISSGFEEVQGSNYNQILSSCSSFERREDSYGARGIVGADRGGSFGVQISFPDSSGSKTVLCPSLHPKIDVERDETDTTYVSDTLNASSTLPAQSPSVQKHCWTKPSSITRFKELAVSAGSNSSSSSSGKIYERKLFRGHIGPVDYSHQSYKETKPIDLCLQQANKPFDVSRKSHATDPKVKLLPPGRKFFKSSCRLKPYQYQKFRRKEVIENPCSPSSFKTARNLGEEQTNFNDQVSACEMGIASKSADLEAYNNNSYIGTKSSTNLNLFGISESEPSHMMVHDDMKTYAVLSGRCDEDMSSHVQSNSTISPQQQTQFQQARQSYSIINYAGPHGQSPNIRAVDLSASPPVRGHRIPISTSPEALIGHQSQNKSYPNINVAHSQHQPNPSLNHQIQQETFQRAFESSNLFEIPDQRHLHTLPLLHHPATPNYGHVHITQQQQQQQQATSQYLLKHEHRREYYDNVSPHPGLTMARYSGSMPQHSGGYMKPPPVDLDEVRLLIHVHS